MKLYAPKYYKEFVCIADKCRHSCCIGWEIDVDGETAEKYLNMTDGYGLEIKKSISKRGVPHFKLKKDDRCPHLDENGLCRIILNMGEGYLCHICREHPRFYNYTCRGKEVGLGMSCEEACRIILSSDLYSDFCVIGETDDDFDASEWEFDAIAEREVIYEILSNNSLSYSEKLTAISEKYGVDLGRISDEEWRDRLDSLEYLDDAHRTLFGGFSSDVSTPAELEKPLGRALAYFVFRHCSGAETMQEYRASIGFSLFCERLLASLAKSGSADSLPEVARIVSEELEYSEDNTEALRFEFFF